jgi:hemolysin activation/secretion protein
MVSVASQLKTIINYGLMAVSLFLCLGAAEFPPFTMSEFEEARGKENAFSADDVPEIIPVPRVSQRAYSAQEQTKFPVRDLVIEGVVPYPELGITEEEIQGLINRRFREEQDIELDDNSFTRRDLREIGGFLRNLADRGGEDEDDLSDLMRMIQGQEFRRGWITVEQLDAIAVTVTEYYRARGFILATAFVPEQEVTDGVIRFNVLEGRLGKVTVSNNEIFTSEVISAAFYGELGEPVTEERIESALRRINDLPGVRVRGSFSPGQSIGETSLNLGVLDEKKWVASVLMDNHGAETTGATRIFATTEWLNVFSKGHRLLVGVLRSEGPDASTYGLAEYEMPVTDDGRGKLKANISRNQFNVLAQISGQDATEIVGETDNIGLSGSYQYLRSRTTNANLQARYVYKDVLFNVAGIPQLSTDQQIEVAGVSGDFSQLWDARQLLLNLRLGIDQGHIINGANRARQSTNFTKTLFNMNLLKRFNVYNRFTKNDSYFNLVVKSNVQYSEQPMPAVEQISLGGPNAVRSFDVSDISVDSGVYAGVELFFDLPVDPIQKFNLPLDPLRPFVFFDYAYGVVRRNDGNNDFQIKAYGLGLRANWPGVGTANLIFATPRSERYDVVGSAPPGESRVFLDVMYQIH